MHPVLLDPRAVIFHGDSADLGSVLGESSIDALITDPPSSIGFMNCDWDGDKGGRDQWVAWLAGVLAVALRVMKPGAYGFVWALPRTSHYTGLAIEHAGFEIVDRVSHIFGSGMPKSIDMARQIDMHMCTLPGRHGDKHLPRKPLPDDHLCPEHSARGVADGVRSALKPAMEDWWLVRKPREGTYAENFLAHGVGGLHVDACRIGEEATVTHRAGHSGDHGVYGQDDRKGQRVNPIGRWPAHVVFSHDERCVLVDTADSEVAVYENIEPREGEDMSMRATGETRTVRDEVYACVPGCPVRMLDAQSGARTGSNGRKGGKPSRLGLKADSAGETTTVAASKGGASRFFFVSKPPRSEKEAGLDQLEARTGGEATGREDDSEGVDNPRAGAGRTGGAKNFHPSVKGTSLMDWLIRLICPAGGTVLDPFAGSGTTGVAAIRAGYNFIGCELTDKYLPVLEGRVRHAIAEAERAAAPGVHASETP